MKPNIFFDAWCKINDQHKNEFLEYWYKPPFKTALMGEIYPELEVELSLISYAEYNKVDVVFYLQEDLFPEISPPPYFLRKIRIALEHENIFGKIYEEYSKLLLINCDLRIIVSYPNWDDVSMTLSYFQKILSTHNAINIEDESILLIFGVRKSEGDDDNIYWNGYVNKNKNWEIIQNKPLIGTFKK
jgi:hypothetical protein